MLRGMHSNALSTAREFLHVLIFRSVIRLSMWAAVQAGSSPHYATHTPACAEHFSICLAPLRWQPQS